MNYLRLLLLIPFLHGCLETSEDSDSDKAPKQTEVFISTIESIDEDVTVLESQFNKLRVKDNGLTESEVTEFEPKWAAIYLRISELTTSVDAFVKENSTSGNSLSKEQQSNLDTYQEKFIDLSFRLMNIDTLMTEQKHFNVIEGFLMFVSTKSSEFSSAKANLEESLSLGVGLSETQITEYRNVVTSTESAFTELETDMNEFSASINITPAMQTDLNEVAEFMEKLTQQFSPYNLILDGEEINLANSKQLIADYDLLYKNLEGQKESIVFVAGPVGEKGESGDTGPLGEQGDQGPGFTEEDITNMELEANSIYTNEKNLQLTFNQNISALNEHQLKIEWLVNLLESLEVEKQ